MICLTVFFPMKMWAEYRISAVLLPASSAVRPSVLSTCTTSDILSTPSPPRSIGHCSGRGRPLPRVLNDVDCLERAPLAPLIRMSNLAMMCYINSHWQKSQVCLFFCCCTADSQADEDRNKLNNNHTINKLETFAIDCTSIL